MLMRQDPGGWDFEDQPDPELDPIINPAQESEVDIDPEDEVDLTDWWWRECEQEEPEDDSDLDGPDSQGHWPEWREDFHSDG
jgi:hypothetical protein